MGFEIVISVLCFIFGLMSIFAKKFHVAMIGLVGLIIFNSLLFYDVEYISFTFYLILVVAGFNILLLGNLINLNRIVEKFNVVEFRYNYVSMVGVVAVLFMYGLTILLFEQNYEYLTSVDLLEVGKVSKGLEKKDTIQLVLVTILSTIFFIKTIEERS